LDGIFFIWFGFRVLRSMVIEKGVEDILIFEFCKKLRFNSEFWGTKAGGEG